VQTKRLGRYRMILGRQVETVFKKRLLLLTRHSYHECGAPEAKLQVRLHPAMPSRIALSSFRASFTSVHFCCAHRATCRAEGKLYVFTPFQKVV